LGNRAHDPDQPQFVLDWARQWQAAEKIVYSRTLAEPRSARTRIEREFDPEAVRRLKADVEHDITVDGPALAAQAMRAGLVDELQMMSAPLSSAVESDSSLTVCGWTWSCSRSAGSATASSSCGTASAGVLVGREVFGNPV
jgi:hypothetical protein